MGFIAGCRQETKPTQTFQPIGVSADFSRKPRR
jgi:hypothetical protein